MTDLFNQYESKFEELKDLEQDDLLRSLRLFNIRLRLAMDIQIDFKGQNSLTKSKSVRDTYVLIIRLNEMWNAYEALSHYANEVGQHVAKGVSKSRIYTQTFLKTVGSMQTLSGLLEWLNSEYDSNNHFKRDFEQYINRIEQSSKATIKADASSVLAHLHGEKSISGIELLSLIYAERNLYYHNGETAKMGMSYSNRKKLLHYYQETLTEHSLRLANHVIDEQIQQSQ
ncbi:hypothetical protein ACFL00_03120 [Pseudomonadota bacterium]